MSISKKTKKKGNFASLDSKERKRFLEFLRLNSEFRELYEKLKKEKVDLRELIKSSEEDVEVPVSIFNEDLSTLESVCKYLKENLGFPNKKIASLINKSTKSVWQAYNNSKQKFPNKLEVDFEKQTIPISIFRKRKSVLESVVVFLKDQFGLSYHEIALLLKRDDRTIWTVYRRIRKKYDR